MTSSVPLSTLSKRVISSSTSLCSRLLTTSASSPCRYSTSSKPAKLGPSKAVREWYSGSKSDNASEPASGTGRKKTSPKNLPSTSTSTTTTTTTPSSSASTITATPSTSSTSAALATTTSTRRVPSETVVRIAGSTPGTGSGSTSGSGVGAEPSQRESDRDILRLKLDVDHSRPITLNRLELLINHPSIAPHQVMQLVDLGRSAGINSGALYSHALHALSRLPTWTRPARYMERVLALMVQDNIPLSTKDHISNIRQLCKSSRVEKAEEVLSTMAAQGLTPSTAAFNLLLQARAKLGHLDKCMELYGLMKDRGVAANTSTLIILMEGFCAFGGLHYAIQMFEKFKADGFTPSTLVCNLLMKQIVELGSLSQMEFFFSQMAKGESIRPDLETYSFVFQAYKKANQKEKQDEVKALLQNDAFIPDLEEMGAKLINLGKAGYADKCEKMIDTLRRLEFPLNTSCYNGLIYAYTHANTYNKRAKALAAYATMIQEGVKPDMDTFQAMLSIYSKNRDWSNVMDTYNKITFYINNGESTELENVTNIPASVYGIMLSCYLETGNYQQAKQMINHLEASGVKVDGSVYSSFITTLGFGGEGAEVVQAKTESVEEVLQMVEHMKAQGHEPDPATYQQLINNLINLHQPDKAFQLLESLCKLSKTRDAISVDLFSPLVRAYSSQEDATNALKVVELMKKVEILPNELLVTALVFCLVRVKQFTQAWEIVNWAKNSGLETPGFADIIQTAQKKMSQ